MSALVSVVIPTYNRVELLAETIDSVVGQSHTELEALVIDDGSADATAAMVRERYADDPRAIYRHQDNAGGAAARNTGLRHARGDLVAFIDADDLWKPWKLELQLRSLELAPEAGMLWTDMEAIGPRGEAIAAAYLTRYYRAYRYFERADLFT